MSSEGINFMNYKEFKLKASLEVFDPIVVNFLNRKEFMLLHASAKTGKSMFALNLCLSVSSGRDFLGMETLKSRVLYLQTEIANFSLRERIEKMIYGFGEKYNADIESNFFISSDRIKIDTVSGIESIKAKVNEFQPSLLVIDPLYDLHSKNEDNASEMAPILCSIREIARSCDCAVVLVHHQGKKGESSVGNAGHACRGSSAFADVPDCSISLSKDKAGFNLRGIFRNRISIDDMRLKFDDEQLMFELSEFVERHRKTKDIVKELLRLNPDGLTKRQIWEHTCKNSSISQSAIQKQIETLRDEGLIEVDGTFKNSKFKLVNKREEMCSL